MSKILKLNGRIIKIAGKIVYLGNFVTYDNDNFILLDDYSYLSWY